MLRVALKLVLAAAAVAAIWLFVPVGGQTLSARWRAARSPAEFVDRTWAELHGRPPAAPPARPHPHAQARGTAPGRPSESHTESDRSALDRVLSQHLDR